MVFKRLDIKVILLGIISSAAGALFLWSTGHPYMRGTSLGLFILWALLVASLVYLVHKMRRDMDRFISSFTAGDVSLTFPVRSPDRFMRQLYEKFNKINSNFRLVRIEKEQEHQFFMHTIQHVGTGLLAFDEVGAIRISNRALGAMLGISTVTEMKHLEKASPGLPDLLENLHPGEQSLLRMRVDNKTKHISVLTNSFIMDGKRITLASFRDISRDIDQAEMVAWQKMMRVVIHEITGSVVPFRLLSSKLSDYLKPDGIMKNRIILEGEALEDAQSMLDIIHKRSLGLARFADAYKALEQLPAPQKHVISVSDIFREVELYFSEILAKKLIKLTIHVDPVDLELHADEQLVVQVLVNLVNNAIQALDQTTGPTIALTASLFGEQLILAVSDNGLGIPEDLRESIFIPFFSTREGGSGIGLSLAKQIMNAHQGEILPISEQGKGTTFRLLFKAIPSP
jgi:two-component system nitrogen regulation sensor histidine kinase NtrY